MKLINQIRSMVETLDPKSFTLSRETIVELMSEFKFLEDAVSGCANTDCLNAKSEKGRADVLAQENMQLKNSLSATNLDNKNLRDKMAGMEMALTSLTYENENLKFNRDMSSADVKEMQDRFEKTLEKYMKENGELRAQLVLMASKNRQQSAPVKPEIDVSSIFEAINKLGDVQTIIFLKDIENGN
jgi:hypothetical protein